MRRSCLDNEPESPKVETLTELHELVYNIFVRNVTISLPDATLEALRDKAKANGKSLNAWLRELLSREAAPDSAWIDEIRGIYERASTSVPTTDWKWNREELHEERLHRH